VFLAADKILLNLNDDNDNNIDIALLKGCITNGYYLEISEDNICMIMNSNATKINAIKKICEFKKVTLEEVIAFGNDDNNLDMLKECGIGIPVSNSNQTVLAFANEVCDSNEMDGVAAWFHEYIL